MVKDIVDLLDSNFFACFDVYSRANYPIAALANDFLDGVAVGLAILSKELFRVHGLPMQQQLLQGYLCEQRGLWHPPVKQTKPYTEI